MSGVVAAMGTEASKLQYRAPQVRWVSSVTGKLVEGAVGAEYWAGHIERPVLFGQALEVVAEMGCGHYVEVGPGSGLLALGRDRAGGAGRKWLVSVRPGRGERQQMLESLGELYMGGSEVDWEAVAGGKGRRRVALPTYPFERKRHWIEAAAPGRVGASLDRPLQRPFLHRRVLSPVSQIEFQSEFRAASLPIVDAHRIRGMAWVNLVVYLEMALEAAREAAGGGPFQVEELALPRGLILPDDRARHVRLVLTPGGGGASKFEVFSLSEIRAASGAPADTAALWVLNASGRLAPASAEGLPAQPPKVSLDDIRGRCGETVQASEFYASFRAHGVALGPACQHLEAIWRGAGEALGFAEARPRHAGR